MVDAFVLPQSIKRIVEKAQSIRQRGEIVSVKGSLIEAKFIDVSLGELCYIAPPKTSKRYRCEVVHFSGSSVFLMPLDHPPILKKGLPIIASGGPLMMEETSRYLSRVVDFCGDPLDDMPSPKIFSEGQRTLEQKNSNVLQKDFIKKRMATGVKAIDGLLTVGWGQRLGIFAGSGVGKSTLLSMIARNSSADVNIVALVGERGREVKEFISHHLGEEGMKKTVVVAATSGEPAMARIRAVTLAVTLSEYFRDLGKNVTLLVDSLTRLALAQREVGILMGEPPTARSYTPSVFSHLASIIERGGSGCGAGNITAFYTILVEGDDFDEPISDAVRGMLDGHIMLSRKLAEHGQFPSIDIPSSLSRLMPNLLDREKLQRAMYVKKLLASYKDAQELIQVGAYAAGSDPHVDEAIAKRKDILHFLNQHVDEKISLDDVDKQIASLF